MFSLVPVHRARSSHKSVRVSRVLACERHKSGYYLLPSESRLVDSVDDVVTKTMLKTEYPIAGFGIVGVDPAHGVRSAGSQVGDGRHTVAVGLDQGFTYKSAPPCRDCRLFFDLFLYALRFSSAITCLTWTSH